VAVKTSAVCQSPSPAIHHQVIASWPSPLLLVLVQKLQTAGTLHFLVPECLSVCFSHKFIYRWEVYGLQWNGCGRFVWGFTTFNIYFVTMHCCFSMRINPTSAYENIGIYFVHLKPPTCFCHFLWQSSGRCCTTDMLKRTRVWVETHACLLVKCMCLQFYSASWDAGVTSIISYSQRHYEIWDFDYSNFVVWVFTICSLPPFFFARF
jgi:hypothetical protein